MVVVGEIAFQSSGLLTILPGELRAGYCLLPIWDNFRVTIIGSPSSPVNRNRFDSNAWFQENCRHLQHQRYAGIT